MPTNINIRAGQRLIASKIKVICVCVLCIIILYIKKFIHMQAYI